MSKCSRCGAGSEHLEDVGVCAAEFPEGWVDRVKEGDRFKVSRPIPAAWLERKGPQSSSPSYTLAELNELARKYVDTLPPLARELTTELAISGLLAWLAKKEREENERDL